VAAGNRARHGTIDRSSGMGEAQGAQGARARAQALEALHAAAVAVWHLQRALAKKRDPLSHVAFADALAAAGAPPPLERFWCASPDRVGAAAMTGRWWRPPAVPAPGARLRGMLCPDACMPAARPGRPAALVPGLGAHGGVVTELFAWPCPRCQP
jgi:hypothetical protein